MQQPVKIPDESELVTSPIVKKLRTASPLSGSQEKFLAQLEGTPLQEVVYLITNRKLEDILVSYYKFLKFFTGPFYQWLELQ